MVLHGALVHFIITDASPFTPLPRDTQVALVTDARASYGTWTLRIQPPACQGAGRKLQRDMLGGL